jgi:hypothetical protein
MLNGLVRGTWMLAVALSTVGGLLSLALMIVSGSNYELRISLKSSERIIENNVELPGFQMYFNQREIKSLYLTKF